MIWVNLGVNCVNPRTVIPGTGTLDHIPGAVQVTCYKKRALLRSGGPRQIGRGSHAKLGLK